MAVIPNKRSNMLLYVDNNDINSHRIKIIAAEKSVPSDIVHINSSQKLPLEFLQSNPQGTLPTLIDRDLVIDDAGIIAEYLDERFPHPPLLPVYPIARAKTRLMMSRIEREWYSLAKIIQTRKNPSDIKNARHLLTQSILSFAPVFSSLPYFLSEEFSLLDCCVAPLLWQLPKMGIALLSDNKIICQYAKNIFDRASFKSSIGSMENEYENI